MCVCASAAAAATHTTVSAKGSFPWVSQFPSSIIQYVWAALVVATLVLAADVVEVTFFGVLVAAFAVVTILVVVISHLQKPAFDEMVPNFLLDPALLNLSRFAAFFIFESM